jgi:hypothetical protein
MGIGKNLTCIMMKRGPLKQKSRGKSHGKKLKNNIWMIEAVIVFPSRSGTLFHPA